MDIVQGGEQYTRQATHGIELVDIERLDSCANEERLNRDTCFNQILEKSIKITVHDFITHILTVRVVRADVSNC